MGAKTEISWTDATFSPWWGCVKVSPGCDHCYADSFSHRLGLKIWGKDSDRRFFGDKHWQGPVSWNKAAGKAGARRRVFCASMCDVMEDRSDLDGVRDRLYKLINATPHLDWLLLTKRPQNFRRFLPPSMVAKPERNVWLMTTIESDEYLWRADALKRVDAVVHGLSVEPLLGDIPRIGAHLDDIEWVIVGGESGHGARPMDADWARRIRDECRSRGIAFFMKQMGGARNKRDQLEDLPEDLRIREFPK